MNLTNAKQSDFAGPCPRCKGGVPNGKQPGMYPGALSRYDNETYICSSCGTEEAFHFGHLIPLHVGLMSPESDEILRKARA